MAKPNHEGQEEGKPSDMQCFDFGVAKIKQIKFFGTHGGNSVKCNIIQIQMMGQMYASNARKGLTCVNLKGLKKY
jgi:hypothetical protein